MKAPYWLLPLVTAGLMGSIHLLPEVGAMIPSAVNMDLPKTSGGWQFHHRPASQVEIDTLAPDTRFSKAVCLSAREGEIDIASGLAIPDRIDLSVVLSGHDLNNSIHRPERCMPSQGHVINNTTDVELNLSNGRKLVVRRLLSVQSIPTNEEHTEYQKLKCVTYYFFVGNNRITHDHFQRTLLDIKDRLILGVDQRWAYVSGSMWYGDVSWIEKEIPIEEADIKIMAFLEEFCENQIDWDMVDD
jgi:hypothetical protein